MDVPICSNISFGGLFTVIKTNVQRQWIASILNNDYNSNQMIMTLLREHATNHVVSLYFESFQANYQIWSTQATHFYFLKKRQIVTSVEKQGTINYVEAVNESFSSILFNFNYF